MTVGIYSNMPAPHQVPIAREIASILSENSLKFVHTEPLSADRLGLGWPEYKYSFLLPEYKSPKEARKFLESCDVLLSGNRDFDLFEKRIQAGKLTIYGSERWLKGKIGLFRLLHPRFFRLALRMVKLFKDDRFTYFPYGIHAAEDMARILGLLHGDLTCLFKAPVLKFEKKPCGSVWLEGKGNGCRYGVDKMRIWGYSVDRSSQPRSCKMSQPKSVLWIGRMLDVKRVDTIIRAIVRCPNLRLDLYGDGPERNRLETLAQAHFDKISFHPPVQIERVRAIMREHDIYVFSSDNGDGWGAVVNEALEEGMAVLGSREAGSSATILPEDCLFHAGDSKELACKLQRPIRIIGIGAWRVSEMAKTFVHWCEEAEHG